MIAEDVAANLAGSTYFESVDVVKPGFINLKLSKESVASYLNGMKAEEKLGVENEETPKTIMIDYGGTECGEAAPRGTSAFRDHRGERETDPAV